MKSKILFKLGNLFICMDELGRVIAIEDTEDNRNPEIGPLPKMGLDRFEKDPTEVLTSKNLPTLVKSENKSGFPEFLNPANPGDL